MAYRARRIGIIINTLGSSSAIIGRKRNGVFSLAAQTYLSYNAPRAIISCIVARSRPHHSGILRAILRRSANSVASSSAASARRHQRLSENIAATAASLAHLVASCSRHRSTAPASSKLVISVSRMLKISVSRRKASVSTRMCGYRSANRPRRASIAHLMTLGGNVKRKKRRCGARGLLRINISGSSSAIARAFGGCGEHVASLA